MDDEGAAVTVGEFGEGDPVAVEAGPGVPVGVHKQDGKVPVMVAVAVAGGGCVLAEVAAGAGEGGRDALACAVDVEAVESGQRRWQRHVHLHFTGSVVEREL